MVLVDWRGAGGDNEKFMYWKREGDDGLGFIEKTSSLVIPDSLKNEFSTLLQVRVQSVR